MFVTFNVFNSSFWICPDEIFKLKKTDEIKMQYKNWKLMVK